MKKISAVCLLALAPAITWANIIPTSAGHTGLGLFTWSYDFQLSSDQNVVSGLPLNVNPVPHGDPTYGAFVTIYDFAGYFGGSCTGPAGWNCTAQNAGYTPDDVSPMDHLDVVNLTWTYVQGPTLLGGSTGLNLGRFTAISTYDDATLVSYAARATKNNGASIGTIADNVGLTEGPSALASPIPEPSTVLLSGLGLALIGWTRRSRVRR